MLVERPSVCVLASTMDDWLLCRVGGFALYSLEHRGGWPLLPAVPLHEDGRRPKHVGVFIWFFNKF